MPRDCLLTAWGQVSPSPTLPTWRILDPPLSSLHEVVGKYRAPIPSTHCTDPPPLSCSPPRGILSLCFRHAVGIVSFRPLGARREGGLPPRGVGWSDPSLPVPHPLGQEHNNWTDTPPPSQTHSWLVTSPWTETPPLPARHTPVASHIPLDRDTTPSGQTHPRG